MKLLTLLSALCFSILLFLGFQFVELKSLLNANSAQIKVLNDKFDKAAGRGSDKNVGGEPVTNNIIVTGVIKKEPIPKELELGDYWYWLYFDKPYLSLGSVIGWPIYINKIQVYVSAENPIYDINEYLNTPVEIYGTMTWGYAESNLIEIIALTRI